MNQPDSPIEAIQSFSEILDELAIPYLIGGSFASSVHGEFRTTNDIDILVQLTEEKLNTLCERLRSKFIVDEVAARAAFAKQRSFNIFHEPTFIKIDIFTRVDSYRREQLSRAQKILIPGTSILVAVATPEDIILSKLAWYKLGNEVSDQQWRDILGVLKVQGSRIDREYLLNKAEELGLSTLLDRALDSPNR